MDTNEIKVYGELGRSILKMYKEMKPNLNMHFYEKVSKFFWVKHIIYLINFKLPLKITGKKYNVDKSIIKERMIFGILLLRI